MNSVVRVRNSPCLYYDHVWQQERGICSVLLEINGLSIRKMLSATCLLKMSQMYVVNDRLGSSITKILKMTADISSHPFQTLLRQAFFELCNSKFLFHVKVEGVVETAEHCGLNYFLHFFY